MNSYKSNRGISVMKPGRSNFRKSPLLKTGLLIGKGSGSSFKSSALSRVALKQTLEGEGLHEASTITAVPGSYYLRSRQNKYGADYSPIWKELEDVLFIKGGRSWVKPA